MHINKTTAHCPVIYCIFTKHKSPTHYTHAYYARSLDRSLPTWIGVNCRPLQGPKDLSENKTPSTSTSHSRATNEDRIQLTSSTACRLPLKEIS
jgi:hypothetical protein